MRVDELAHVGSLDVGQPQPPERARRDVLSDVTPVVVEGRPLDVAALLASGQPVVEPPRKPDTTCLDELALIVLRLRLRERRLRGALAVEVRDARL